MTKVPTIGVAGVTIPGAIDCINKINQKAHGFFEHHHHPNIILHQPNFGPTHHAQNHGQWEIVEDRLIESIETLAKGGADFVIIPANTVHKVIDNIKNRATIPVLSMLDMVAAECHRQNLKKVGILGTRWTMADHLYQNQLHLHNIEEIIPSQDDQGIVQKAIFEELIPTGNIKSKTLDALLAVTERLKVRGCDGVALACTELPLVLNRENCGMLTLDTTAILAEGAVRHALTLMQPPENLNNKSGFLKSSL
ncbi:MAG: amino acid racemase [Legionella sp.]|nr:amino acid racemase [Legionella sp.]